MLRQGHYCQELELKLTVKAVAVSVCCLLPALFHCFYTVGESVSSIHERDVLVPKLAEHIIINKGRPCKSSHCLLCKLCTAKAMMFAPEACYPSHNLAPLSPCN